MSASPVRLTLCRLRPRCRAARTAVSISRPSCRRYATSTSSTILSKPPQYGQPTSTTHPHLVKPDELTIGVSAAEYEARRAALMRSLPDGSVVVCMGGTVRLVSQSIFYKFRQATDFFYLSGFNEPDATLVLESRPSSKRGYKYTLFVPPSDPHTALWEGGVSGIEGAIDIFGADEAYPNTLLSTYLPSLLSHSNIYCSLPPSPSPSAASQPLSLPIPKRRRSSLLKLFSPPSTDGLSNDDPPHLQIAAALASERAKPLEKEVQKFRLIKSLAERRLMRKAADLSSEAHTQVMRMAKEGMSEAQLAAHFEYVCAMGGSERPAYVPVVASGANALVIHWTRNDCVLNKDDLVLIDAGCEYGMYASDITRTFPASGAFSAPQRDLYQAVLNAQKECIKLCKVGAINMNELQRTACSLLTEELRQIGFHLATGDVQRRLYPHYISHHLGSDLHDCPTYDRSAALVEGNTITVEPGIYVPPDSAFPKHFHTLGVRIEDDVAITREGPEILSVHAPKEIVDVEGACQGLLGN
ncbi:putative X-Pro aminopeptidase [Naematelia encephala]|uniref:Putative X-Pro aminopeptidase n=1 Tax=Naematelia encephala TaxID=71784 RepID=A0A1Y2B1F6_9TREE|nr:putative X-Pro aminopeptidase [Naematelia encephala]